MAQSVHRPGPPLGVLVAGGAVSLALVAAAVRPPWEFGDHGLFSAPAEGGPVNTPPPVDSSPAPVQFRPNSAGLDLSWLPWVLLGVAVVVGTLLILRRLRGRRRDVPQDPETEVLALTPLRVEPDLPTLRRGAAAADERLLAIGDPTDAIVAAWLALEEAAADSGVPRPPASTPTEFTAEVLQGTGAPGEPVRTLLSLYLRARFAAAGAGPADLTRARACVRALAEHWSAYAADRADAFPGRTP